MYDKELITRICNLTCSKDDISTNLESINYDTEYPFEKYYDVNIIIGAINKYLSKEWDDRTLAGWLCIYNWIICGGFSNKVKECFNPLEQFLVYEISWDLDGLSFFDEETYFEDNEKELNDTIEGYKTWDYIWQTRDSWKGVYATINECNVFNGDQYILLINDKLKEYAIVFSFGFLSNNYNYQNEYLRYISKNKFVKLIEQLKKEYKLISYSEDLYYSDLYNLDE